MSLWDWWKSLLLQGSRSAPPARRLDGRSKTLLAASINALPYDTPGLITNKEAKQLGLLHAESRRWPVIAAGRPLGSCAWSSREWK
jgi:hypothetical protein